MARRPLNVEFMQLQSNPPIRFSFPQECRNVGMTTLPSKKVCHFDQRRFSTRSPAGVDCAVVLSGRALTLGVVDRLVGAVTTFDPALMYTIA